ncbi:MAG: hypothetical protein ACP6IU_08695 [Candidatus Asgardarchaeia archaeon]
MKGRVIQERYFVIYDIIIFQKNGIPILWRSISGKKIKRDPRLIAGLLSAMQSFSKEVIGGEFRKIDFNDKSLIVTNIFKNQVLFAAIVDRDDPFNIILPSYLSSALERFFEKHADIAVSKKINYDKIKALERYTKKLILELRETRFSDLKDLLSTVYVELVSPDIHKEIDDKIIYDLINERNTLQRQAKNEGNRIIAALRDGEKHIENAKVILEKAIENVYNWNLIDAYNLLRDIILDAEYGYLARLLLIKIAIFANVQLSCNLKIDYDALKKLLHSINDTKKHKSVVNLSKKALNMYLNALSSNEPTMFFKLYKDYSNLVDEIINVIKKIDNPLERDVLLIILTPISLEAYKISALLEQELKDKSLILHAWLKWVRDRVLLSTIIYSVEKYEDIRNIIKEAKKDFFVTKTKLSELNNIILFSNKRETEEKTLKIIYNLNLSRLVNALHVAYTIKNLTIKEKYDILTESINITVDSIDMFVNEEIPFLEGPIISLYFWHLYNVSLLNIFNEKAFKKYAKLEKPYIEKAVISLIRKGRLGILPFDLYTYYLILAFISTSMLTHSLRKIEKYNYLLLHELERVEFKLYDNIDIPFKFEVFATKTQLISSLAYLAYFVKRQPQKTTILENALEYLEGLNNYLLLKGKIAGILFIRIVEFIKESILSYRSKSKIMHMKDKCDLIVHSFLRNKELDNLSRSMITIPYVESILGVIRRYPDINGKNLDFCLELINTTRLLWENEDGPPEKMKVFNELEKRLLNLKKKLTNQNQQ